MIWFALQYLFKYHRTSGGSGWAVPFRFRKELTCQSQDFLALSIDSSLELLPSLSCPSLSFAALAGQPPKITKVEPPTGGPITCRR